MTKAQDLQGKAGQEHAQTALRRIGVMCVEKIGTPVRLIPTSKRGSYMVIWGEKVSGDHRGIVPGGRSVLAETKTIYDRNLAWSDLRPHQPARLDAHTEWGGLTLLVWVSTSGVFIMRWPIPEFGPGKSITLERAQDLDITAIDDTELNDL
jgi:hypothetical protein